MQLSNLCSSEDLHLQYNRKWTSRGWLKQKWQPDMLKRCRDYVVMVLETGLLFKEDSLLLEDALQIEDAVAPAHIYGIKGFFLQSLTPNFTSGEKLLAAVAMGVCIASVPLKIPFFNRGNLMRVACWTCASVSTPLLMRRSPPQQLPELVELMTEYTALVRRGIARARDNNAMGRNSRSPPSETMGRLVMAQQKELCYILQSHIVFLRTECLDWRVPAQQWEDFAEFSTQSHEGNLTMIHNQYLLVQSTYLRILASIHMPIAIRTPRKNQDKNTKLYILHSSILPQLIEIYQTHVYTLKSAHAQHKKYQKLNMEDVTRKPFINLNENNNSKESWQYSEIHNSAITLSSELKNALQKCLELDGFLDACWNTKSKFSPSMLEDDLSKLKIEVFKCVTTIETMEIKIKKIKNAEVKLLEMALQKLPLPAVEEEDDTVNIRNVSEDTLLPIEDQVFYFVKNQENTDDLQSNRAEDYLSAPGFKEIAATKAVLGELRVKLVEREEVMRERERKALVNTMPEFLGNVPEFPRQMGKEFIEKNSNLVKNIDETCDKINDIDPLNNASSRECVNLDVSDRVEEFDNDLKKNGEIVNTLDPPQNIISYSDNANDKLEMLNLKNSGYITKLGMDNETKGKNCDNCNLLSDPSCSCKYSQIERNELLHDVRKYRTARRQHKPSKYRSENLPNVESPRKKKLAAVRKGNGPRSRGKAKLQHNTSLDENDLLNFIPPNIETTCGFLNGKCDISITNEQSKNVHGQVFKDDPKMSDFKNELKTNGSNPIKINNINDEFLDAESSIYNPENFKSPESNGNLGNNSSSTSDEQPHETFNRNIAFEKFDDVINKKLIDAVIESNDNSESESSDVKNDKRDKEVDDEGMKPTEYSFGTGMAIASLLQIPQNQKSEGMTLKFPAMACEEVFIGDGEVSDDSGNED